MSFLWTAPDCWLLPPAEPFHINTSTNAHKLKQEEFHEASNYLKAMPWFMRTFCHLISCWLYQTKFLIAGKIQQNKILTFFKNCMENRKYKSDIFLVRPHFCLLVGISTRNVFIKVQRCRRSFRLALVYLKASRPSQPCYKRQDIECFLSKYSWCWF